jgi:hypothetical protein
VKTAAVPPPGANRPRAILDSLVRERQRLEAGGRDAQLLEANRLAIVYWQEQAGLEPRKRH